MIIYLIVGLGVVVFVSIGFFIVNEYKRQNRKLSVVPISDIDEIQKFKRSYPFTPEDEAQKFIEDAISQKVKEEENFEENEIYMGGRLLNAVASSEVKKILSSNGEASQKQESTVASLDSGIKDDFLSLHRKAVTHIVEVDPEILKLKDEVEKLQEENSALNEALKKEISLKKEVPILDKKRESFIEMEEQFIQREEEINALADINVKLTDDLDSQAASIEKLQEEIKIINNDLEESKERNQKIAEDFHQRESDDMQREERFVEERSKVEKLEVEIWEMKLKDKEKAEMLKWQKEKIDQYEKDFKVKDLQVKSMISDLMIENETVLANIQFNMHDVTRVKDEIDEIKMLSQKQIKMNVLSVEVKKTIAQLVADNKSLLAEVQRGRNHFEKVRHEINKLKILSFKKIKKMTETVENSFSIQKELNWSQQYNEKVERELANTKGRMEALTQERQQLLGEMARKDQNYLKLKEFNARILEKEKTLHYELSKSRAHSLGLERLCEDFSTQIENSGNEK